MMSDRARLGPVRLAHGISKINALTYLYSAFAGVALTTFVSVIMPYVMNVNIGLPMAEQGRLAGDLVFYGELVLISLSGPLGAWSDKLGRRAVFIGGLALLGAGYIVLGYVGSGPQLIAVRIFATIGIAAVSVMVTAIQVDYPAEESRGKLVGFAGIAIGLGAVLIGVLFTRLPDIYSNSGYSNLGASRMTMFTMAAFCLLTALIIRVGLVGGPPTTANPATHTRDLLVQGISVARTNPRLLLAYACGFIGRADLVVVGTFYSLWLTQAGISAGLSAEDAAKTAGAMFALVMSAALLWAPVMGWMNDRLDRTVAMTIALLLAMLGYGLIGFIDDPLSSWIYPASVVLGIGQISVTLAGNTLVGQESPPELRGAVVGTFSVCGAAGILFVTGVGGRLYDGISPTAPFVMIGLLNGALAVVGVWLYRQKT